MSACSHSKKDIVLYCDSLLDEARALRVKEHLAQCLYCQKFFNQLTTTLQAMKQTDVPKSFLNPGEVDAIVQRSFVKNQPHFARFFGLKARPSAQLGIGISLAAFALGAILLVIPVRDWMLYRHIKSQNELASAVSTDIRIVPLVRDSLYDASPLCAVRVQQGGSLSIVHNSATKMVARLAYGTVCIADHKRLSDSVIIECGAYRIHSIGTRYVVRRENDSLKICVIEGQVCIRKDADSALLSPDPARWVSFTEAEFTPLATGMDSKTSEQLVDALDEMDARKRDLSDTEEFRGFDTNLQSFEALTEYTASKLIQSYTRLIEEGRHRAAVKVLHAYLLRFPDTSGQINFDLGYCLTRCGKYHEAIAAYRDAQKGSDRAIRERSWHRINKILFYKLHDVVSLKESIQGFLMEFPASMWRENELKYMIESLKGQKKAPDTAKVSSAF